MPARQQKVGIKGAQSAHVGIRAGIFEVIMDNIGMPKVFISLPLTILLRVSVSRRIEQVA